mgnify:CR=1 FL=1
MHPNQATLIRFYSAFNVKDAQTMAACYHAEASFGDPVFTNLQGEQIGMMWKMLCLQAKTLTIEAKNIQANDKTGSADWTAIYAFGKTKRRVHNKIQARFVFKEGKIIEHTDVFDFWKWSRMALGPMGLLLGWNPVVRVNVQRQAMANLTNFTLKTKNA